jgi:myo-inositol 2-dehydrogenase/D-chiro-inositol 1-dehydrogenase
MSDRVGVGVIGAGRMGSFHAQTVARRLPDASLSAVADPLPGAAHRVADAVGATAYTDAQSLIDDHRVTAVVIASTASVHADLVIAAAGAGKPVFCEKPMALTLADADRALDAVRYAGVQLQVGFNRRFAADFAAARDAVSTGGIGRPQLLRSLTRDPGLANPGAVKPWTIFRETLIHDFDALRWLNRGAEPVEVYAIADALIAPDFKDAGLLDTSVAVIRFDNGAMGTAEASFAAAYGYDVRAEVFGSDGMVQAGHHEATAMRHFTAAGVQAATVRRDVELFADAYTAEMAHFVECVRTGATPSVTGADARGALAIALACIRSVERRRPVQMTELEQR